MKYRSLMDSLKNYRAQFFKRKVACQQLPRIVEFFEHKKTFLDRLPLITYVAAVYMSDSKIKQYVDSRYGAIRVCPSVVEVLGNLNKELGQPIKVEGKADTLLSLGDWLQIIHFLFQHEASRNLEQARANGTINTRALALTPIDIQRRLADKWISTLPVYKLIEAREPLAVNQIGISYLTGFALFLVLGSLLIPLAFEQQDFILKGLLIMLSGLSWLAVLSYCWHDMALSPLNCRHALMADLPKQWTAVPSDSSAGAAYLRGLTSDIFPLAASRQFRFALSPEQAYLNAQFLLSSSDHVEFTPHSTESLMANLFGAESITAPEPQVVKLKQHNHPH